MGHMWAYDVAKHIAEAREWACRPQEFGADQARLLVEAEERWLGVTTVSGDLVHLHAGHILKGVPTDPVTETSAQPSDMESLLGEVDLLWQALDRDRG
ncbi:hypothetical protein ACUN29_41475 (plasmid) [Streptomyces sp. WC2508]|uniref:hypothetical protein n=1 Tax=Streptomyces sp. WC2508 TaxID=3461405 RepID=UPI00404426F7